VSRGRVAVFLDRDGTLNEEVNYVRTPDDLHLIAGAGEAVRNLNDHGLVICVISNQSGVARGYLEEKDLIPIHAKLEQDLAQSGASIDKIYYCPHHPTEGIPPYNIACECRKPKIGMLERGAAEFGIDLGDSFVVGDSMVDMQAGNAAGARTVLVLTGYGITASEQCTSNGIHVGHVARTIVEAIDFILNTLDGETKA
jgi:D-glycero-D-manno-heptose 1,7-bisphosphate phosphatase